MGLLERLFNRGRNKKELEKRKLAEEKIRLEQEKMKLKKERMILEREKNELLEKQRLDKLEKNKIKTMLEEQRKLEKQKQIEKKKRQLEHWKQLALEKHQRLIEEEIKKIKTEQENSHIKNINKDCAIFREESLNNSEVRNKNIAIGIDKYEQNKSKVPLYDSTRYEIPVEINIEYQPYLSYSYFQYSNYNDFLSLYSFDVVKRYKDRFYLRLGYENIGYDNLYDNNLSYEDYEDVVAYYEYIYDREYQWICHMHLFHYVG